MTASPCRITLSLSLVTALALATAACGGGGGSEGSSTPIVAGATNTSASGQVGGVGAFAVTVTKGTATVKLYAKGGTERGVLHVSPVKGGYVATLTVDGVTVTESAETLPSEKPAGTAIVTERKTPGAVLRTETVLAPDGTVLWAALLVPVAKTFVPTEGTVRDTAEGRFALFPTAGSAAEVAGGDPKAWLASVNAAAALGSPASLMLTAALGDPTLVDGLLSALAAPPKQTEGTKKSALHLTQDCVSLYKSATGSKLPCCQECSKVGESKLLGIIMASSAITGIKTSIEVALKTYPQCECCRRKLQIDLANMVKCAEAATAEDVKSAKQCAEDSSVKPWQRGEVEASGHGCKTVCDPTKCDEHCTKVEKADLSHCMFGSCTCAYKVPLCAVLFPQTYCTDTVQTVVDSNDVFCIDAKCGDGILQAICAAHPNLAEQCDSGYGINGPCRCAADCKKCDGPCECDLKDPKSWPAGKRCNANCTLVPVPKCDEDPKDFFANFGQWCDPKASANWCEKGHTCAADTCRCKKDAAKPPPGSTTVGEDGTLTLNITYRNSSSEDHIYITMTGPKPQGAVRITQGSSAKTTLSGVKAGDVAAFSVKKPSPDGPVGAGSTSCTISATPTAPTVTFSGSLSCSGF